MIKNIPITVFVDRVKARGIKITCKMFRNFLKVNDFIEVWGYRKGLATKKSLELEILEDNIITIKKNGKEYTKNRVLITEKGMIYFLQEWLNYEKKAK